MKLTQLQDFLHCKLLQKTSSHIPFYRSLLDLSLNMDQQLEMASSGDEDVNMAEGCYGQGVGEEEDWAWLSGIISSIFPDEPANLILVVKITPSSLGDILDPEDLDKLDFTLNFDAVKGKTPSTLGPVSMSPIMALANEKQRTERIGVHHEVLTSNSQLFSGLYQTALAENQGREIKIHIDSSEEAALISMIHFMYKPCPATLPHSVRLVLDIIMIADKFEVAYCISVCSDLLSDEFPMTLEMASSCLEAISKIKCIAEAEFLYAAALQFLVNSFGNVTEDWSNYSLLCLPLAAMKAVLASDSLRVPEESEVFLLVMDWASRNYGGLDDQTARNFLTGEFGPTLRFAHMSTHALLDFVNCSKFDHEFLQEAVFQALVFKTKVACSRSLGREHPRVNYVDRGYHVPVDVTVTGPPVEHCSVIIRLSRSQCCSLLNPGDSHITSQVFWFFHREMRLRFQCYANNQLELLVESMGSNRYPMAMKARVAARRREVDGAFKTVEQAWSFGFSSPGSAAIKEPFERPFGLIVADPASSFFLDDVFFVRVDCQVL